MPQTTQVLSSPTPKVLILGLVAYGAGASTLYHLNRRDKHQDKMLAAGIVIGGLLGISSNMDGETILFIILPWIVLIALWLSNISHRFWYCNSRHQFWYCSKERHLQYRRSCANCPEARNFRPDYPNSLP